MSDFIATQLKKETLSPETYDSKIKLNKNEVSLQFLETKNTIVAFKLYYLIQINLSGRKLDPSKKLSPKYLDMDELEKIIISKISNYDKEFIILKKFDDKKAEFEFDYKKWLKKATKGIKGTTSFSKFDREFRFKIKVPKEIKKDRMSYKFDKFIERKFLDWLEENESKQTNMFSYLIPKSQRRKLQIKIRNMFDWYYDSQWNKITAKLKSTYVIALLYSAGLITKRLSRGKIEKSKKELFSDKVKKNSVNFDRKKWEEFSRKKFF